MTVYLRIAALALLWLAPAAPAQLAPAFLSHAPQRALTAPAERALGDGPAHFVDAARGDDAAVGTEAAPWRTVAHGLTRLTPGDTLVLRGGTYYECVTISTSGTADKPITLCAYPGERVIMDGGLREFFESPAEAWEPFAGGAPGEYRSTKAYPQLGEEAHPRRYVYVMGNFGDSMVPLHGYRNLIDLRWPDMYRAFEDSMSTAAGMYCGPGVWYDAQPIGDETYGTKRIHIRLAHTDFPALGDDNYRGETDPRKLPLVIGGPQPVLEIRGAKHLRVQDLVFRGSRSSTVRIDEAEGVEMDHVTLYGGAPALTIRATHGFRLINASLRGVSAPWSSRGSEKYRGVSTYLFTAETGNVLSDDIELGGCEFTDCHDGLWLLGIRTLRLHHSLISNFNDDGLEFGPKRTGRELLVHENLISRCLIPLTLHGKWAEVPTEEGSGVYLFRNVIDQRMPVHYAWPAKDGPQEITSRGHLMSDHGSPPWPVYYLYHNTILVHGNSWRGHYGAGLARATRGTRRRVFNNLIIHAEGAPGFRFPDAEDDWQADGQLHWSFADGVALAEVAPAEHFRKANRKGHPAEWGAHDLIADPKFVSYEADWTAPSDLRLRENSPAIDAGIPVPVDWPDPLRERDAGKPDIGAMPAGCGPLRVGPVRKAIE